MSHDCDNFTGSMGCLVTMIALLQLGELLQKKYQRAFLEVFPVFFHLQPRKDFLRLSHQVDQCRPAPVFGNPLKQRLRVLWTKRGEKVLIKALKEVLK